MSFLQVVIVVLVFLGSVVGGYVASANGYGILGIICGGFVGFVLVNVAISALLYAWWMLASRHMGTDSEGKQ
jgi:hypothetical protein